MPKLITTLALIFAAGLISTAHGQTFPSQPIRIVATAAGGSGDLVSRQIAQAVGPKLGQPIIVENTGTGIIPARNLARSKPDGHTLLMAGGALWLSEFLVKDMPFDVLKDFAPITLAVTTYSLLIATQSLPTDNVKGLIALAKKEPGKLNYGVLGLGSSYHINGEMFKNMTGTDITAIQYKASSIAMTDLIAGRIHVMFSTGPVSMPFVKSGKVKALGVTSLQPSALAPGIAPIAQSGVPGYEYGALLGLLTTGGTPAPIVRRLNQEIVAFIKSADARDKLLATGVEPVGSTPEEFTAVMKNEMDKYGKIIKAAGIQPE